MSVTGLADGEMMTCVDWSSDNSYLVAATNKGNIAVISCPAMSLSKVVPSGRRHNICTIVCHPDTNEAVFADLGGHWGLMEAIEEGGTKVSTKPEAEDGKLDAEDMEALFNDDDDDENSFSVAKVAAQVRLKIQPILIPI